MTSRRDVSGTKAFFPLTFSKEIEIHHTLPFPRHSAILADSSPRSWDNVEKRLKCLHSPESMLSACSFHVYSVALSARCMPAFRPGAGASEISRTHALPPRAQHLMTRRKEALSVPGSRAWSSLLGCEQSFLKLSQSSVTLSFSPGFNHFQRTASFRLPFLSPPPPASSPKKSYYPG